MYHNIKVLLWNVTGDDEYDCDVLLWNGSQCANTLWKIMVGKESNSDRKLLNLL